MHLHRETEDLLYSHRHTYKSEIARIADVNKAGITEGVAEEVVGVDHSNLFVALTESPPVCRAYHLARTYIIFFAKPGAFPRGRNLLGFYL